MQTVSLKRPVDTVDDGSLSGLAEPEERRNLVCPVPVNKLMDEICPSEEEQVSL
jgi:hypothetical protein